MNPAYDPEPWTDLALGMAGAAAALAGLLFVAVSINLESIVSNTPAPRYAAEALIMLVSPVFLGLVVLVPAQGRAAVGVELLIVVSVLAPTLGWLSRPSGRAPDHAVWEWLLANVLPPAGLVVSLLFAGVGLLTDALGGLYWLPGAVAFGLLGGLAGAWMLLIEIRRPD